MSLDSLTDNVFDCGGTPVWFPPEFTPDKTKDLNRCNSCVTRLVSPTAGPGILRPTLDGFTVDENPLVTFFYNGLEHTLMETRIVLPGAHRLPGESEVSVAEFQLYFRANYDKGREYCLCIPLQVGEGPSTAYFDSLDTKVVPKRPTLSTIIPDSEWVQYKGADLRGRTKETPRPRTLCEPVQKYVTYLVSLKPANIHSTKLNALKTLSKKAPEYKGPATPTSAISLARITTLLTLLPPIQLKGPETQKVVSADGSVTLNQMKCYRLDQKRDIKGDRVYLGGKGAPAKSSLKQELQNAADLGKDLSDEEQPTIQAGDIESVLSIVLGVLFGVVVCATLAYYVLGFTYTNYLEVVNNLYKSAVKPASSMSLPVPSWIKTPVTNLCDAAKIGTQIK